MIAAAQFQRTVFFDISAAATASQVSNSSALMAPAPAGLRSARYPGKTIQQSLEDAWGETCPEKFDAQSAASFYVTGMFKQ